MKCIVCDKEATQVVGVIDGYMDSGKFDVCEDSNCYREIVAKGVFHWDKKKKEQAHEEYLNSVLDPRD